MLKRGIILLLIFILALTVTGCGAESSAPSPSITEKPGVSPSPSVDDEVISLGAAGVESEEDVKQIKETAESCIALFCTVHDDLSGYEYLAYFTDGIEKVLKNRSTVYDWAKSRGCGSTFLGMGNEEELSVKAMEGDPEKPAVLYENDAYYGDGEEFYVIEIKLYIMKTGDEWLAAGMETLDAAGKKAEQGHIPEMEN